LSDEFFFFFFFGIAEKTSLNAEFDDLLISVSFERFFAYIFVRLIIYG